MRIVPLFIFFLLNFLGNNLVAQDYAPWVDSTYQRMSNDERIGQVFMIRAFSQKDPKHYNAVQDLIKKYKPGGICFFQGSPEEQARVINNYQTISEIPMLVAIDGEWGVGMRFPGQVISFPRQLMLGAIQDENLIYEMGKEVANQCKTLGIHVNFGPVVDINNNAANPVINNRSFGEDIYNVAAKGFAYMKGMQDNGVIACAKHFPGHGDTDTDSHFDMPVINHSRKRLDSVELKPFKVLIDQGVKSIMVAHMHVPAIDDRPNMPTTLSDKTIKGLLQKELGFKGIVFTDAMEMKGVLKHFPSGIAEAEALLAGNDMIVLPVDFDIAFTTIKKYLKEGKIASTQFENSVKKILQAKFDLKLNNKPPPLNPSTAERELNKPETEALKSRMIREAITLVSDKHNRIPYSEINNKSLATLSIGGNGTTQFQKRVSDYATAKNFSLPKEISESKKKNILSGLKGFSRVIVSIHDMSKYSSKEFGISPSTRELLDALYKQNDDVTTVLFGSPYALTFFSDNEQIVVAYEEDNLVQDITAQALFGASNLRGKLPVSAGGFSFNTGEQREALGRLGYDIPESVGLSSDSLAMIDTIVKEMINMQAAPGCQILVAKDGKIVYDKSFGYFTYKKKKPVNKNNLYDVASVTKVMASTISLMKLVDDKKIKVTDRVSKFITQLDTTDKKDMVFDEMLAHHSRLAGWIPFYMNTVTKSRKNPRPKKEYYAKKGSSKYSIPVAKNLYMRADFRDSIWSTIYGSTKREYDGYRYSDLAFYLVHQTIENITGKGVDGYAEDNFYKPLGLSKTAFNPYLKYNTKDIAPTEEDVYFRRQRLQGYVHDMGAAMLGGVSGHAGLFSTSKEMAILLQMLLNGGTYGGKRYLSKETIDLFTTRYHRSTRRGLGFDMKELDGNRNMNMSDKASDETFGHLGFTGTAIFADPKHNLVYVILSNRTYPRMQNNKFGKYEFRPRIQSVIYNAMLKEELP